MSSMIEQVSRAICALNVSYLGIADTQTLEERIDDEWPYYEQDARAAIEAMMECTKEMENAGVAEFCQYEFPSWAIPKIWEAMLTAALAEAPGEG